MQLPGQIATGIVSEVRMGILLSSENEYLKYPVKVMIHVVERTTSGGLMRSGFTVNDGEGAWVLAKGGIFEPISEPLPCNFNDLKKDDIKKMLANFYIYSSQKLGDVTHKLGVFDE